ncbi:hypothetical protein HanIR_Chr17g0885561 [Helianthus annuus]|nr:hypothetical protein HanIR_Chr17g0885561 [Helianthus annuus]
MGSIQLGLGVLIGLVNSGLVLLGHCLEFIFIMLRHCGGDHPLVSNGDFSFLELGLQHLVKPTRLLIKEHEMFQALQPKAQVSTYV